MSNIRLTSHHKPQPLGANMKQVRDARRANTCPFREPVMGVMPPAEWRDFSAVACFGNEQPPAGYVQLRCEQFAARIYVPAQTRP